MKRIAAVLVLAVILAGGAIASAAQPVDTHTPKDVIGKNGMVAAAHPLASAAGIEILKAGGNAIDAAIATGLALWRTAAADGRPRPLAGPGMLVVSWVPSGVLLFVLARLGRNAEVRRDLGRRASGRKG